MAASSELEEVKCSACKDQRKGKKVKHLYDGKAIYPPCRYWEPSRFSVFLLNKHDWSVDLTDIPKKTWSPAHTFIQERRGKPETCFYKGEMLAYIPKETSRTFAWLLDVQRAQVCTPSEDLEYFNLRISAKNHYLYAKRWHRLTSFIVYFENNDGDWTDIGSPGHVVVFNATTPFHTIKNISRSRSSSSKKLSFRIVFMTYYGLQ